MACTIVANKCTILVPSLCVCWVFFPMPWYWHVSKVAIRIHKSIVQLVADKHYSLVVDVLLLAVNASSYIVSVVLLLLVAGTIVGVLSAVPHHLHHHHRRPLAQPDGTASIIRDHYRHKQTRHHHYRHCHNEETPTSSLQRRLLLKDNQGHPATPVSLV